VLIRFLEEQKFCLIWLNCQTSTSQPFITDCVPGSEEPFHVRPLLCARKQGAIIDVHPEGGIVPSPHLKEQGGCVSDGKDWRERGALWDSHWLLLLVRHNIIKLETYLPIRQERSCPLCE
jgi:hypothetical protein